MTAGPGVKQNILLVHGAFHDERCWRKLQPLLDARGFRSHCVSLRGHGANRFNAYRVSMASYADDVCNAVHKIGEPCVVVGHSMGGMVISAAAERCPQLFSSMIYLAAMVPRQKSTLMALHKQFPNDGISKASKPSIAGSAMLDRVVAKQLFYGSCDAAAQDEAAALLCAQPIRPSFSAIRWTDQRLGSIPKHYIECIRDRAVFIDDQRVLQSHMKFSRVETMDCDHSPFWSMPQQLADVIGRLLRLPRAS